jgi:hypothetical protein
MYSSPIDHIGLGVERSSNMTSFVHIDYPSTHPGVERFETAIAAASKLQKGFDSAKSLAGVMLAAMAAALVVVVDQLVDTWADGHLLAVWVLLWVVAFAAITFLAPTTRYFTGSMIRSLDAWSSRVARERADERLWEMALKDPRVMADLRVAADRSEVPGQRFEDRFNASAQ